LILFWCQKNNGFVVKSIKANFIVLPRRSFVSFSRIPPPMVAGKM
jgi:hypothetical protein